MFKFPPQILYIALCFQNVSLLPLINRLEFVSRALAEMKPTVDRMKSILDDAERTPVPLTALSQLRSKIDAWMEEYNVILWIILNLIALIYNFKY